MTARPLPSSAEQALRKRRLRTRRNRQNVEVVTIDRKTCAGGRVLGIATSPCNAACVHCHGAARAVVSGLPICVHC